MMGSLWGWYAENVGTIYTTIMLAAIVVGYVLKLLVKAGYVKKKSAKIITQSIEDAQGVIERSKSLLEKKKRKVKRDLTEEEIALATIKALKGEIRERSIKEAGKAIFENIAMDAAEVDPKVTKKPTVLNRIGNLIRNRVRL
jgi:hypothetical protein